MNITSRLRLFIGIIITALVSASLVIYVQAQQSALDSEKAEINAAVIGVGTDYTGLVTKQLVQDGDHVTAGQTLFHIKSSAVIEQMRDSGLKEEELINPLSPDGEILLKAPKDGTVSKVMYGQGSFVPANTEVAQIIDESSVRVTATYQLARRDFARVTKKTRMEIHLPNGDYINSTADTITVVEQNETVETEIEAKLERFQSSKLELTSGTPVNTTLHIKEDTLWRKLKDRVGSIF